MIEATLRKRFPKGRESSEFTLDVQFSAPGGLTVLFGPSGAGKSLILDCLAGFARPDEGRILLDSDIVYDGRAKVWVRPQERRCGYVFQSYAVFPHMTVRDNIRFGAWRWPHRQRREMVDRLLKEFRLQEVSGRKPHQLSGGQKQRCSIARALGSRPRLLLLDEPAQGLDAGLQAEFADTLRRAVYEFQTPAVVVTHDLRQAVELADHLVVMKDGRIVQQGSAAEIVSRPPDLSVAELLGIYNVIKAEVLSLDPAQNRSVLRLRDGTVETEYLRGHLLGDRVFVLVRPEALSARPEPDRPPGTNQVSAWLQRFHRAVGGWLLEFDGDLKVYAPETSAPEADRRYLLTLPSRGLVILQR